MKITVTATKTIEMKYEVEIDDVFQELSKYNSKYFKLRDKLVSLLNTTFNKNFNFKGVRINEKTKLNSAYDETGKMIILSFD